MKNIWILFKREMMTYFFSPIAYIVGCCFLGIIGISFCVVVGILSESSSEYTAIAFFFNGIFSWITLLAVAPVITMRLFADEKKTGTIETLMTTPLRNSEYVLAKFLSGYAFFLILWAPTVNCIFVLRYFANDHTPLDIGSIVGGYLGISLIGMLFIAIGCMASACTRNQIIAAVLTLALTFGLFLAGIGFYYVSDKHRDFFESISMLAHLSQMSRGVVEWQRIVFYLSGASFFLFITHRIVQSREWKS